MEGYRYILRFKEKPSQKETIESSGTPVSFLNPVQRGDKIVVPLETWQVQDMPSWVQVQEKWRVEEIVHLPTRAGMVGQASLLVLIPDTPNLLI